MATKKTNPIVPPTTGPTIELLCLEEEEEGAGAETRVGIVSATGEELGLLATVSPLAVLTVTESFKLEVVQESVNWLEMK